MNNDLNLADSWSHSLVFLYTTFRLKVGSSNLRSVCENQNDAKKEMEGGTVWVLNQAGQDTGSLWEVKKKQ